MNVAKITLEKANEIKGKSFKENQKYAPVEDANGNMVVSMFCAAYLPISDFTVIEFVPKPDPILDE